MKNLLILTAFFLCSVSLLQAQAPQAFNYQAVARDANNNPYQNTTLGIRISLVRDNPNGASDFIEEHQVVTTDLGVFTLQIGKGI